MPSFILDCETPTSTLSSLCWAYQCDAKVIVSALEKIDLEAMYTSCPSPSIEADDFLFEFIADEVGAPELPEEICWFHFTRTTKGESFAEGIRPLGDVLPKVWDTLIELAPTLAEKDNLRKLRANGVPDFQYGLKVRDSMHWGPYGCLVRGIADHARALFQHDYLAMPEIIEDICNGYKRRFGTSLIEHYSSQLRPCAVKFVMPAGDRGYDTLKVAVSYMYSSVRREAPSTFSVTCFDGAGNAVPFEKILSVKFVEPATAWDRGR